MLTDALIERMARVALTNVATEFPYKLDQVLGKAADLALPRSLHPLFWGSYDWHSCVHMHWTLLRLLRRFPAHALATETRAHLDGRLTRAAVAGELTTLRSPHRQTFERPYGWGWLLKLAAELEATAPSRPEAQPWLEALRPLAQEIADRLVTFLARSDYPTRAGAHGNSAFALILALDWCMAVEHIALRRAIERRANAWFGRDRHYPAEFEPSGDDFLSGGLVEAALMLRVVDGCSFADWWDQFRPTEAGLANWLLPAKVSDAADAKVVHLHGLNLSRAWCWVTLRPELPEELQPIVDGAIRSHLAASLAQATRGDYVGTHWLVSFALLALDEVPEQVSTGIKEPRKG